MRNTVPVSTSRSQSAPSPAIGRYNSFTVGSVTTAAISLGAGAATSGSLAVPQPALKTTSSAAARSRVNAPSCTSLAPTLDNLRKCIAGSTTRGHHRAMHLLEQSRSTRPRSQWVLTIATLGAASQVRSCCPTASNDTEEVELDHPDPPRRFSQGRPRDVAAFLGHLGRTGRPLRCPPPVTITAAPARHLSSRCPPRDR